MFRFRWRAWMLPELCLATDRVLCIRFMLSLPVKLKTCKFFLNYHYAAHHAAHHNAKTTVRQVNPTRIALKDTAKYKDLKWCRGHDLNLRQPGLQPSALPGWATSALEKINLAKELKLCRKPFQALYCKVGIRLWHHITKYCVRWNRQISTHILALQRY